MVWRCSLGARSAAGMSRWTATSYDNALMDIGSTSTLPNGTVFAVSSGVNSTSIASNFTFDSNMVAAVALDPHLLRWIGSVIANPTNTSHPTAAAAVIGARTRDTPAPGQLPRYSFRDPTSPWLDACAVGQPELCFFLIVGSGNITHNNALLHRSRSDVDVVSPWVFVKVVFASVVNDVFDHACPGYVLRSISIRVFSFLPVFGLFMTCILTEAGTSASTRALTSSGSPEARGCSARSTSSTYSGDD